MLSSQTCSLPKPTPTYCHFRMPSFSTLSHQVTASLAVERPEISEVLNLETGEYVTLQQVVTAPFSDVIFLRAQIKLAQLRGEPLFVCAECSVPVGVIKQMTQII